MMLLQRSSLLLSDLMSETKASLPYTVQKEIQHAIEESGCIAIVTSQSARGLFLYTVGNTEFGLPELLVFCTEQSMTRTYSWLQKFCQFMQETAAIPHPHRELTFQKRHYYPILMDRALVDAYATAVNHYYNAPGRVTAVIQLISPDSRGNYPHEQSYTKASFQSPYLRCH